MLNNEYDVKKYCCLYASDYHLEMILLPYIKNHLDKFNFLILTQANLFPTINLLLERTNFNLEDKKKILSLNWFDKKNYTFSNNSFENTAIIINGNEKYIQDILKCLNNIKFKNSAIICCYDISDKNFQKNISNVDFDAILNTHSIQ